MSKAKKAALTKAEKGILTSADGSVYSGEYIETLADGSKIREGMGSQTTKNGVYEGQWVNDAMNGRGKYTRMVDNTSEYYEGEFVNNMFSGEGIYKFRNGSSYEGQWKDSKMDGVGKLIDEYGVEWRGSFREGNYDSLNQSNHVESIAEGSNIEEAVA